MTLKFDAARDLAMKHFDDAGVVPMHVVNEHDGTSAVIPLPEGSPESLKYARDILIQLEMLEQAEKKEDVAAIAYRIGWDCAKLDG